MPDERGVEADRPRIPHAFAERPEDARACLALTSLVWMTPRRRVELAAELGTASEMLRTIGAGRAGSRGDAERLRDLDLDDLQARVRATRASFVPYRAPGYPPQLAHIDDPPIGVFVSGPPVPDVSRCVAVVGSRGCSDLGRELATELGRGLALAGVAVVSGAARGIDSAAHVGALEAGGRTAGVLGCGIDLTYPPASRAVLERIRASGTLLSEFPPGTPPHPRHFPSRNRLVAGLCRATVVVEGGVGSGSLITAEHAMEFGRDVFAVPGAVTNPLAAAPLQLIRDGAGPIRGADDLLADLGIEAVAAASEEGPEMTEDEERVFAELRGPTLPDRVATALGVTVVDVMPLLTRLELRGLVRAAGGRYEPTARAVRRSG